MTLFELVAYSLGKKVADFSEQCGRHILLVIGAY